MQKPDNSSINSFNVDGITHFEVIKSNKSWKKINKIEKNFKNLIAMRGVTFVYKRDTFWRTWRDVDYKMSHKTIFYKCSNIINTSCTGCYGGGFWVIEEDQIPCPYEIFSMINKNKVCAVNYTHLEKIDELCPSELSLFDLTISCNNPIVTLYRITKSYSNSTSERNHSDICGGREFCEISTIYRIYQDYITFQIINLNKDVIYSKVMMNNNKTFAYLNTTLNI
ncbi:uncharacterized protein LOC114357540 [Ostrinia furnacalis]|uniref:uncharacterized protein LOC114357540 n=1 Tax=Ostrinia furnacalis TaxID=93504 RepID=UPI001040370B|nr:uncharacterized protein LOC114357540 [Ostrinia furnacalis]